MACKEEEACNIIFAVPKEQPYANDDENGEHSKKNSEEASNSLSESAYYRTLGINGDS